MLKASIETQRRTRDESPTCSCCVDRMDQDYSSMVVRKMTVVHADVDLPVDWAVTVIRVLRSNSGRLSCI